MEKAETKNETLSYKIICFGIIILLGLLSFSFGGATGSTILGVVGCIGILTIFAITSFKIDKQEIKGFAKYLIPFFIFAVLISFNRFYASGSTSNLWPFASITCVVAIVGMMFLGYFSKRLPGFSFRNMLIAIVGGLSLLVLINLIASLVDYSFFYYLRYSSKSYFYDGFEFNISSETQILNGFSIGKVSIKFGAFMPFLLGASLLTLPFFNYKKDKVSFLVLAGGGCLGVLSLLLIGYWKPLLLYFVIGFFVAIWKFVKRPEIPTKVEKITFWVIYALMSLFFFIMFLNSLKGTDWFANSFLRKIFSNGTYTLPIEETINLALTRSQATSFSLDFLSVLIGPKWNATSSFAGGNGLGITSLGLKVFEFSALSEGGLICFLGLYVFLTFIIISTRKFVREGGNTPTGEKAFPVIFLLAFFFYYSLSYDNSPYILSGGGYFSIFRNSPYFLLCLFLIGYIYTPKKTVGIVNEPSKTPKEEVHKAQDDDDDFHSEEIPND